MRFALARFEYDNKDLEIVGQPDPKIVRPASRLFEADERPGRQFPAV